VPDKRDARTKTVRQLQTFLCAIPQDNPRRLGKGKIRLVGFAPRVRFFGIKRCRHNSPVPLAALARRRLREIGTERLGMLKPFRVESSTTGWFLAWMNRSHPEGEWLLLCSSTEWITLAFSSEISPNQKRPTALQSELPVREVNEVSAGLVTKLPSGRRC
jgi:hypothetical protein